MLDALARLWRLLARLGLGFFAALALCFLVYGSDWSPLAAIGETILAAFPISDQLKDAVYLGLVFGASALAVWMFNTIGLGLSALADSIGLARAVNAAGPLAYLFGSSSVMVDRYYRRHRSALLDWTRVRVLAAGELPSHISSLYEYISQADSVITSGLATHAADQISVTQERAYIDRLTDSATDAHLSIFAITAGAAAAVIHGSHEWHWHIISAATIMVFLILSAVVAKRRRAAAQIVLTVLDALVPGDGATVADRETI